MPTTKEIQRCPEDTPNLKLIDLRRATSLSARGWTKSEIVVVAYKKRTD